MSLLPVSPAHELAPAPLERRWLIEQLWTDEAVGLIGGEPKCCKSLLALHLAVAVASGTPCLRRFAVPRPGRVLLFQAEDALHVVRERFDAICAANDLALDELDIQVITVASLRLDVLADLDKLRHTVELLRPRLLILDPFIRLHNLNENSSGDIAAMLQYLRHLQRSYRLAVAVVHHAKKGASHIRAGQALRGSSEFHAWSDSALHLRRSGDSLILSAEHRAAPSIEALTVRLVAEADALALEIVDTRSGEPPPQLAPEERVRSALASASAPLRLNELRDLCRLRKATLCEILANLGRSGHVIRGPGGYALAAQNASPGNGPPIRAEPVPGTAQLPFDNNAAGPIHREA